MSSEVSNADLLKVMLEMKGDVGALRATAEAQAAAFKQHVQDDAALARSVSDLRLGAAKKAGAASVWTAIYASVSGALGAALASYFKHGQ